MRAFKPLAILLAIVCGFMLMTSGGAGRGAGSDTESDVRPGSSRAGSAESAPLLASCPAGGYLCANVERAPTVRVRRWIHPVGTVVVHVPFPDFESSAQAARLQSAAAAGIRAWNGHPFPIRVVSRSPEGAHFAVRWVPSLGGDAVGVARTRWSAATGLQVTSIDLATRNPFRPGVAGDPDAVRLTAAHEMGHALGLPHSDSSRDVMYPSNTASSLTARDYRSMEALYALPDGAELKP